MTPTLSSEFSLLISILLGKAVCKDVHSTLFFCRWSRITTDSREHKRIYADRERINIILISRSDNDCYVRYYIQQLNTSIASESDIWWNNWWTRLRSHTSANAPVNQTIVGGASVCVTSHWDRLGLSRLKHTLGGFVSLWGGCVHTTSITWLAAVVWIGVLEIWASSVSGSCVLCVFAAHLSSLINNTNGVSGVILSRHHNDLIMYYLSSKLLFFSPFTRWLPGFWKAISQNNM